MGTTSEVGRIRLSLCRRLPRLMVFVAGLSMMGLALAAGVLGFDPNPAWGPYRKGMFLLGLAFAVLAHGRDLAGGFVRVALRLTKRQSLEGFGAQAWLAVSNRLERWDRRLSPSGEHVSRAGTRFSIVGPRQLGPKPTTIALMTVVFLVVEVSYLWFTSVGFWTDWPGTTLYYDKLAEAFLHGQTALLIAPDPRLEELPNPYSFEAREAIPQLWDATYYEGKYYLYWGPVPALIASLFKMSGVSQVGDNHIAYAAIAILWLFSALAILDLWNRFGGFLPEWMLPLSLLVVGTVHPILWILNRPAIHEAAIASAQAFLMGGLFVAMPRLAGSGAGPPRLFLAGLLWSMAMGSRLVTAAPVVVLCAFLLLGRHGSSSGSAKARLRASAALLSPMLAMVLLYGLYNIDRFGNPFEPGMRYVLSGRGDYSQPGTPLLNSGYVLPNLYNYTLRGVRTLTVFPFVKPIWGRASLSPLPIIPPDIYYPEQVTGVAVVAPFLFLAAFLAWWLSCPSSLAQHVPASADPKDTNGGVQSFRRLTGSLVLASVAAGIPLLLYFTSSQRFLLDVAPLAALCSVAGSWVAYRTAIPSRSGQRLAAFGILFLALFGMVLSALLAVTGFEARFEHLNPDLFDRITRLFAW